MTAEVIPTSGSLYADLQSFMQQSGAVGVSSGAAPQFVIFEILPDANSATSTQANSAPSNPGLSPNPATNTGATTIVASDSSGTAPTSGPPGASDAITSASNGPSSTSGAQFSPSTLSALVATQENSLQGSAAPNTSYSSSPPNQSSLSNATTVLSSSSGESSNDSVPSYYVSPYTTGPDTVTAAELQAVGLSPTSGKGALLFGQPTPLVHGVSLLDLIAQGNIAEYGSPAGPTGAATSAVTSAVPPTQVGAVTDETATGSKGPGSTSDTDIEAAQGLTRLTSLSRAAPTTSSSTLSPVTVPAKGYNSAYQLLERMIQLQAQLSNSSENNNVTTA